MSLPADQPNSIFHELGNGLAVLSGLLDLLTETELSPEQEEIVTRLSRSRDHLQGILSLRSGKKEVRLEEYREQTMPLFAALIRRRPHSFRWEMEDGVSGREYFLDEMQLTQILINLVKNAAVHTDVGEISLRIEETNGFLEFHVCDTGKGVNPKALEAIFAPGVRLSEAREGSGLGLSICKQLAEEMGGSVRAKAGKSSGCVFTVKLPAAKPPETTGKSGGIE